MELTNIMLKGWPNINIKLSYTIKIYCKYKSDLSSLDVVVDKQQ